MNATRLLSVVPFALAVGLAACSSPPSSSSSSVAERTGTTEERVIGGKNSDTSQDAVVLVFFYDKKTGMAGACTGTLLAPNLVLTARHCVAQTDEAAACDTDGNPIGGSGNVYASRTPDSLMIFKGKTRPQFYSPSDIHPDGVGATIVDDGSSYLCNHDIALIVLKAPIKDAPIAPIRLDGPPKIGETFTAVGWGVTDTSAEPDVRQQRSGIAIETVGPDTTNYGPVAPNEFQVGESICQGDSGGPAIAKTGAVIGVVSRGGNGRAPSTSDPSAGCVNAMNLYSKVAPFKKLILKGFSLAKADPWNEGGPDPRKAKLDEACTDASDCRSNICLADPGKAADAVTCAQDCSDGSACPDGETCQVVDGQSVCRTPPQAKKDATSKSGGCSAARGTPANGAPANGVLAVALAVIGAVLARRRR